MNVVLFSQRKVMANQFYELDRNENIRVIVLRADGDNFSSGGNIAGFLEETLRIINVSTKCNDT